jgi:outer membrane protein assembly factor BamB
MTTEVENKNLGSDRLWNNIATASAIFAFVICILLIANYIQVKKSDPVNMTVINSLVERLHDNPADADLRREIRTLDLLSRKAYFTSQWQIRTGGYLLLASVALMIISLQIVEYRRKINPVVSAGSEDETMLQRKKARTWIVTGGGAILVVAVIFAFLSSHDLTDKFAKMSRSNQADSTAAQDSSSVATIVSPAETPVSEVIASIKPDSAAAKAAPVATANDNYPNFRGNGGTGNATKKNIPTSWNGAAGTNILWKTAIPLPGYNSPIIWGDRLFVTGASSDKREIYCFDRNSGKIEWTFTVGVEKKDVTIKDETGYSAPTAVTDGKGVYAIFPTGEIAAVDMNGKKIWERDLGVPKNYYGHSSSLMLFKDNIIVQLDQTASPKVMALSVTTGKTLWSTDRPVKVSWSSPILVNTGKRNELILVAEPYVASYNPATGQELWKIDCISGEVGPSLTYADGIVFSVNDYSKLSAIKVGDQPTILWENNDYLSDIPSPAANDKYLFLATSYGTVVCYDTKTGQKYWEKDFSNNIFSSPMIVEGRVYLLDRTGVMHIFKADKEFSLISESDLGEQSACTPAFTDGRIYLRGDKNLYCIGK